MSVSNDIRGRPERKLFTNVEWGLGLRHVGWLVELVDPTNALQERRECDRLRLERNEATGLHHLLLHLIIVLDASSSQRHRWIICRDVRVTHSRPPRVSHVSPRLDPAARNRINQLGFSADDAPTCTMLLDVLPCRV